MCNKLPHGCIEFSADYLAATYAASSQRTTGDVVLLEELTKSRSSPACRRKFLQFNGGHVVRRNLRKGDVLCREGEYGSTAFILLAGEFEAFINAQRGAVRSEPAQGIRGFFGALRTTAKKVGGIARAGVTGGSIDRRGTAHQAHAGRHHPGRNVMHEQLPAEHHRDGHRRFDSA